MKVIFIPFNNRNTYVPEHVREALLNDIFDTVVEHHLDPNEKAILFFYLSHTNYHFMEWMERFPPWADGANVTVRKRFSLKEADRMALELAGGDRSNVISFKFVPEGLLEDHEMVTNGKKEQEKWDWGYCVPVEIQRTP